MDIDVLGPGEGWEFLSIVSMFADSVAMHHKTVSDEWETEEKNVSSIWKNTGGKTLDPIQKNSPALISPMSTSLCVTSDASHRLGK